MATSFTKSARARMEREARRRTDRHELFSQNRPPVGGPHLRPTEVHGLHVVTVTPVTRKVNGTVVMLKAERPKAWAYTGATSAC